MGLKRKLGGLKRREPVYIGFKVLIVLVIFVAGMELGNGWIGQHMPWSTKPVATGLPARLNYSSVNQIYQSLKDNYDGQLNEAQVLNGLKHGLAQSTNDPYTEYFTPQEAKQFNQQLNNSF